MSTGDGARAGGEYGEPCRGVVASVGVGVVGGEPAQQGGALRAAVERGTEAVEVRAFDVALVDA